jgi:hypothetical protein
MQYQKKPSKLKHLYRYGLIGTVASTGILGALGWILHRQKGDRNGKQYVWNNWD